MSTACTTESSVMVYVNTVCTYKYFLGVVTGLCLYYLFGITLFYLIPLYFGWELYKLIKLKRKED